MNRSVLWLTLVIAGSNVCNVKADESKQAGSATEHMSNSKDVLGIDSEGTNAVDASNSRKLIFKKTYTGTMGNFDPPDLRMPYAINKAVDGVSLPESEGKSDSGAIKGKIRSYPKSPRKSQGNNSFVPVGDFYAGMHKGQYIDTNTAAPKSPPSEIIDNHEIKGKLIKKDKSEY